jgi:hypothetical protein
MTGQKRCFQKDSVEVAAKHTSLQTAQQTFGIKDFRGNLALRLDCPGSTGSR